MSVVQQHADGVRLSTQVPRRVADRAEPTEFRFGLLVAATVGGAYLVFVTELLSALGSLRGALHSGRVDHRRRHRPGAWGATLLRRRIGLIAAGFGIAMLNDSRPLVGRDSVLTTGRIGDVFPRSRPAFRASYLSAVEELQGCRRVAIEVSDDYSWEYPIWTLLPADVFGDSDIVVVPEARGRPCSAVIELNHVLTAIDRRQARAP
jgi:hypothetical protein